MRDGRASRYAELQVTRHFSFPRGASSCQDLFSQAALCGSYVPASNAFVFVNRAAPNGMAKP